MVVVVAHYQASVSVIAEQSARLRDAVLMLSDQANCPYRAINKQATYCSVPDVVGQSPTAGRNTLTAAGFGVIQQSAVDNSCEHIAQVMSQSLSAGTVVLPDRLTVTIKIGTLPAPPRSCG